MRRDAPRASSRLERFAHAISSTTKTAAESTARGARYRPVICASSGVTLAPQRPRREGFSACNCFVMAVSSACARSGVTFGPSRPDDRERVPHPVGLVAHGEGHQEVDARGRREDGGEVEGGGQDTHDGRGLVVERDRPSDDSRVGAKAPLPERVGQDDGAAPVEDRFLADEVPPQPGLDAEDREKVLRHAHANAALRLAVPNEVVALVIEERAVPGQGDE